ncbi:hypothetical protein [Streptomyces sp. NBC_01190]|uniref:hypothetical protein n=1 Tax=Streptomyces sp. NBC_01190 TaxID=2903767 RepID=UPI0038705540|nr:hypothetical protein OG519_00390 [Streptomyces sp. NBC_01190]
MRPISDSGSSTSSRRGTGRAGALAAALAVIVPAMIAGTAGPAAAATGSLAVTMLDRDGQPVTNTVSAVPLDTPGAAARQLTSGTVAALTPGQYALLTSSYDGDPVLVTLGGRIVTVTGGATTAVTIDARQGRELKIATDSGAGDSGPTYAQAIAARVCVDGRNTDDHAMSNAERGRVFVIPNADPRTQLGYVSNWAPGTDTGGDAYAAAGTVPLTGDPITVPIASTGSVVAKVLRGPSAQDEEYAVVLPRPQGSGCELNLHAPPIGVYIPYQRTTHATAGVWEFSHDSPNDYWRAPVTVTAGSTTSLEFGRAVWGPARYLPWVQGGQIGFDTSGMVADPLIPGGDNTINATATLYRDGKAVATKSGLGTSPSVKGPKAFTAPITASAAYTLKVHGFRHADGESQPAGMMSTATDAAFSFHAGPTSNAVPPAFLTRFLPSGLDLYNRTQAGHATPIPLTLDRTSTRTGVPLWPATVQKVEVFASTDGGRSWHPLTVTRTAGAWATTLPAQAAGTEISLSARVTDTGGNQTVSTVYRAFITD